jgi:hypothetical protein
VRAVGPIIERAQRILELCRKDGDFQPVLFVFTAHRGVDVVGLHWSSPEEKDAAALATRVVALAAQPLGLWGIMLIMDSREWEVDPGFISRVLGVSEDEAMAKLAERPDLVRAYVRPKDCLLVTLETYLGDYQIRLRYDRAPNGRVTWHPPLRQPAGQRCEGRFVNLLPPLPSSGVQA